MANAKIAVTVITNAQMGKEVVMENIKLLEKCPNCGEHLTLMASVRVDIREEKPELGEAQWAVKRCLKCGRYPVTEVVQIKE